MRICPDCASTFGSDERFCQADGAVLLAVGDDPLIGHTVGSYRLVRMLGEGGMGQVYLGVHPSIGSRVAVKVLDPQAASRKDLVDRFFAEATAVNRIRHENIVNVLDLDNLEVEGTSRPYIIMEHLEGQPLAGVLAHFGRLPQGTLSLLVREILGALSAAHGAGIIHRDLKPDNIFVSPQGRAKVLDFGIAKLLPNPALGEPGRFTQTGMLLGTPSYMSPEQARGQTVTPATDLYALGVILYEAATGVVPFRGETLYELLNKHVTEAPVPPRTLDPNITPALEGVILQALAKDPAARFANADHMAAALTDASASFPMEAWASISLAGETPALIANPTPRPTPSSGRPLGADGPAQTPRVARPAEKSSRAGVWFAAAAVLLVASGVAALLVFGDGDGEKAQTSQEIAANEGSTEDSANGGTDDTTHAAADSGVPLSPSGTETAMGAGAGTGSPTSTSKPPTQPAPTPNPAPNQAPSPKTPSTKPPEAPKQPANAADPKPAADDESGLKPFKGGPGVTVISTQDEAKKKGFKQFKRPTGVSTKSFNGSSYLSTAKKLARELMPDASLIEFDVSGVSPSGRANLHKSYSEANFWFRSKKLSVRDPDLPRGATEDVICKVYVELSGGNVEVYPTTSENCKEGFDRNPRCTLKQVWNKAYALGAPKGGNWVAKITYNRREWFFDIKNGVAEGDDFTESIPDDC